MNLEFQEYRTRKILNTYKHVDGWFWNKYSAHPYVGCRSGCEFCYLRGGVHLGRRDPNTFDTHIQVKMNAIELFKRELARVEKEVVSCGDWQQPAEERYTLSRQMLLVVRDAAFPLFIVERSPLLARDIDLLAEIQQRADVRIVISLSNVDEKLKRIFEPRSPGIKRRLKMMAALANVGITVGTSLMPILPFIGDRKDQIEDAIRATKDHGGTYIVAGGLTMAGVQAERSLGAAREYDPATEEKWRKFFNWREGGQPNYGPTRKYNANLGLRVRELCAKHDLKDRMPRPIRYAKFPFNKRVAEKLLLKVYDLELGQAHTSHIWTYRKAAWAIDELSYSVEGKSEKELQGIEGVSTNVTHEIADWAKEN